jgi:hypothetical protein
VRRAAAAQPGAQDATGYATERQPDMLVQQRPPIENH